MPPQPCSSDMSVHVARWLGHWPGNGKGVGVVSLTVLTLLQSSQRVWKVASINGYLVCTLVFTGEANAAVLWNFGFYNVSL